MIEPDHLPNMETEQAKDGDRTASLAMWGHVADGKFSCDVQSWLQHVAVNLLDAQSKDAGTLRDRAIVRALGLEGRMDKHRDLRDFAYDMRAFGASRQKLVEMIGSPNWIQHRPAFKQYRELDPIDLARLIDRELAKLPKPK